MYFNHKNKYLSYKNTHNKIGLNIYLVLIFIVFI